QDIQLLHECMTNIYENKITPQVVSIFEKNENEIIEKIRDASKIKMEDYAYISLSDAYTTYQVCSCIFNKETPQTNPLQSLHLHSLAEELEPKNMILIKVKFLENGRKVHFTVILGVREIFLANLI
ncbi:hypothetical protein ACT453_27725, partial [Bacillus sp. D-CC]